jgi:LysM repeat protein
MSAKRMERMRRLLLSTLPAVLTLCALSVRAQVPVDNIETQLSQLYQTAKVTADGTDIVTAGSVLILQKDHLLMDQVDQLVPTPNLYKDGKISQGGLAGAASFFKGLSKLGSLNPLANNAAANGAASAAGKTREFVSGEKFWVSKIETHPDGVTFNLISDPIKDQRYHATLHFPFAKGASPSPDDVAGTVSEVLKIDGGDDSKDQSAANQAQQPAAAPAATKTVALGQTRDQVIAAFGVPSKVIQLGPKEIDVFSDMKVTFVQNKVVDVK